MAENLVKRALMASDAIQLVREEACGSAICLLGLPDKTVLAIQKAFEMLSPCELTMDETTLESVLAGKGKVKPEEVGRLVQAGKAVIQKAKSRSGVDWRGFRRLGF